MSFQIRTVIPEGVDSSTICRELGRLLEGSAMDILTGVPPDRYQAAAARYQAFNELMQFIEERIDAQRKGETTD